MLIHICREPGLLIYHISSNFRRHVNYESKTVPYQIAVLCIVLMFRTNLLQAVVDDWTVFLTRNLDEIKIDGSKKHLAMCNHDIFSSHKFLYAFTIVIRFPTGKNDLLNLSVDWGYSYFYLHPFFHIDSQGKAL